MSQTKLQFSAGGVIYRKTGAVIEIVLLIRGEGKVFCLPKGKIEKPETPQEAALREVKEETGLNGIIENELGRINYWFYSDEDKSRVHKSVYFYLVRYSSGNTADHDADAEDVKWLSVDEALKIMSYSSERQMVEKAKESLQASHAE